MSWITWSFHILKFVRWDSSRSTRYETRLRACRFDSYRAGPWSAYVTACNLVEWLLLCWRTSFREAAQPSHYISELRVSGMQWKHFKGSVQPIASRELAAVCLILWILAGSKLHPRKFLFTPLGCALPRAWLEYQRSIYLFLLVPVYYFICVFEFALFFTPLDLTL